MWINVSGNLINLEQTADIAISEDAVVFTMSHGGSVCFKKKDEVAALKAFFASRQNLSSNFLVDVTALFGSDARIKHRPISEYVNYPHR